MSYEAKLTELGYTIEPIELNAGKIMHAVRTGNLIYTSGQVSRWGDLEIKGKVGRDLSVKEGYKAAQICALNCLRAVKAITGSLDSITQIVKLLGMVMSRPISTIPQALSTAVAISSWQCSARLGGTHVARWG